MDDTILYVGMYKDESRKVSIQIANNLYNLSFTLNGALFISTDMEEWKLANEDECTEEQLNKIHLTSVTFKDGFNLITEYYLKDCEIEFTIPQQVLIKESAKESIMNLKISIHLEGLISKISVILKSGTIHEEINNITDFDFALQKINNSIYKKYTLFNCYNCRYSSYNVYGQSMFGSLQCYKGYKETFLKIKNKSDYVTIQDQGYETVQETYYCEEFQLPDKEQFLYK